MNIEPVEAITSKIEELITAPNSDQILTADDDVVLECARRYVAIEHAKRNRKSPRNDPAFQKTKAELSENLRVRLRSIVDEMVNETPPGVMLERYRRAVLAGQITTELMNL